MIKGKKRTATKRKKIPFSARLSAIAIACIDIEYRQGKHKSRTQAIEKLIIQGHFTINPINLNKGE